MDISYLNLNNSLKYDELFTNDKCWILINNIFEIGYITKWEDCVIISGKYRNTEFQFKIVNENCFNDFKINKFNGH